MKNGFFLSLTGFSVLIVVGCTLFISNVTESVKFGYAWFFILINMLALTGLGYVASMEFKNVFSTGRSPFFGRADLIAFSSVVIGSIVTFQLSTKFGLGPVTAAGLVGLIAALYYPKQAVPAYCGAFVGMSCPLALPCNLSFIGASVLAGLLFVVAKEALNGFGGKLGTIAFFGTASILFFGGNSALPGTFPGWRIGLYIILFSILAAVVTFIINIKFSQGPVMASSLTGFTGGIFLPLIYPETGLTLATIVICASFAGMSSQDRITGNLQMVIVGLLAGLFFIHTLALFPGAGGKLGTIAFIACIAVRGWVDIYSRASQRFLQPAQVRRTTLTE